MRRVALVVAALVAVGAIAFLLLRTPDSDPAALRRQYGPPPSRFVALAGGPTVHLRDEGPRDAPVILLLHGSNADLHTWDAWTADLARDHRVVRFDQRGHGLTGAAPDGAYGQEAYVADVERVARRLGLTRFVIAGNSMGGGIALRFALEHPERLRGLVLVDAAGAPPMGKPKGNLGFTLARNPLGRWAMKQFTPRALIAKSVRQTVADPASVSEATIERYWQLLRYPGNRAATAARFAQPRRSFTAAQLAALHLPVLILWGEKDPLIPFAAGQWLQRSIPGSTMLVYPGIGHIPMEEAARRSVADLRAWLGGHTETAAGPAPREAVDARRPVA